MLLQYIMSSFLKHILMWVSCGISNSYLLGWSLVLTGGEAGGLEGQGGWEVRARPSAVYDSNPVITQDF